MNLHRARRLLGISLTALVAYTYGRVEASFGIVPLLVFTLVALVAWSAGYVWATAQHSEATATAHRERDLAVLQRDLALARIAQLQDGERYQPIPLAEARARRAHPAGRAR